MHLWYLVLLFIFSLIALPFFLSRNKAGNSIISKLANSFQKPWALLMLFVPLAAVSLLADVAGLGFTRPGGN